TYKDIRKTGSIYGKSDILNGAPMVDDKWFKYSIKVVGNTATIALDDEVVNQYEEPENPETPKHRPNNRLGKGTFAIQGHDPHSVVFYRNIRVRAL
ncbi:MAG: DUF1080 domain-containing protein, partial [Verrucomicrobiota bacterium]